ncbi:hypothetical protein VCHA53O466_40188 [Vibrio chagasii]|nr:hypothetical protein VCHA53O466_40188 [Vibrio chagasii]
MPFESITSILLKEFKEIELTMIKVSQPQQSQQPAPWQSVAGYSSYPVI